MSANDDTVASIKNHGRDCPGDGRVGRRRRIYFSYAQIITLFLLVTVAAATILLSLPYAAADGTRTPMIDALFSAASATGGVGLSPVDMSLHWSLFGQIVILVLIQFGALGFMTLLSILSIFVRRQIGVRERQMMMQSTGSSKMDGVPRLLRNVLLGTFMFETSGAVLLFLRFAPEMGIDQGIFHAVYISISSFCTAGIAMTGMSKDGLPISLSAYRGDLSVNSIVIILMIAGGIGFFVWNDIARHGFRWNRYDLHTKIVIIATSSLIIGGFLLFLLFEWNDALAELSVGEKFLAAFFSAVSMPSTGFSTVGVSTLSPSGFTLILTLMFIGGSPGSTAGGIKNTTFAVIIFDTIAATRRSKDINVFGRRLSDNLVRQASAIAFFYMAAVIISTMIISAIESFEFPAVLLEVMSAISTAGLSVGITSGLGIASKLILIFLMCAGKLGGVTLMLVLMEKNNNLPIRYPEERIMIG